MKTNFSKYADAPIRAGGVIPHKFINASEAPAQYEAEQCDRQAVTVEFLADHPDLQGYLFLDGQAEIGLDPWRMIEGVDYTFDRATFFVEWGRTAEKEVDRLFQVFVSRKQLLKELAS